MPAAIPLVGPAENEGAGTTLSKGSSNLPVEDAHLSVLSVPNAIQTYLRQEERPIAGNIMKPRNIIAQALLGFQIDVEGDKIYKIQFQIFGGWVIDICEQAIGIFRLEVFPQA